MTKKDYIKIANVFINAYAKNTIEKLENNDALNLDKVDMLIGDIQSEIITIFENDNFRFSTETFTNYITKGLLDRYRQEFQDDIKEYPDETKQEQRLIRIYENHVSEF